MWMLVDAARLQTASVGRDCIVFVLVQLHQLTVHFKTFFYFIDHFLSFGLDEEIANIFGLWIINENEILRQHKVLLSVDPKLRFWIKKSDPLWVYCTSGMDEADELTPFLFQRMMGMGGGEVSSIWFAQVIFFRCYYFTYIFSIWYIYMYVCMHGHAVHVWLPMCILVWKYQSRSMNLSVSLLYWYILKI